MKHFIALGFFGACLMSGCGLGLRPRMEPDAISEGVSDGGSVETPDGGPILTPDAGPTALDGVDPCPRGKVLCDGGCVGTPLVPEVCQPTWTKSLNSISVNSNRPVVFDIERKELLLLRESELMSLVEGEWKLKAKGGSGSYVQRGVYLSKRKVVFFFAESQASTWEWNGFSWSRRADGPPLRKGHALAYDSERDRVVLFGGQVGATPVSDTWEWDGAVWTEVKSAAGALSAREDVAMAYDVARRKVVLFGGYTSKVMNETWEFDGQTWTKRTPTRSPAARQKASMAYDAVRHRAVLFGGRDASNLALSDLWEWDGFEWTQRVPLLTVPTARGFANFVYDAHRQVFVLVGGDDVSMDRWELSFP